MTTTNRVRERLAEIAAAFQAGQRLAERSDGAESARGAPDPGALADALRAIGADHTSVAFEGAAAALAVRDLEGLEAWRSFADGAGAPHAAQVHAGLGFALARARASPMGAVRERPPLLAWRIVDGGAYHDGLFDRRRAVNDGSRPELPASMFAAYDQGLGRSLWFTARGDPHAAMASVATFGEPRRSALWRGLGVACTYAGGFSDDVLDTLSVGESAVRQLAVGAALVAHSRVAAGTVDDAAERATARWCAMTPADAAALCREAEPSADVDVELAYARWVAEIEFRLRLDPPRK